MTAPIRIEGGLFAPDFLDQLGRLDRPDRADLPGLRAEDFGFAAGTLDDEIATAYRDARAYWLQARDALDRSTDARRAVRIVRDRWLRPFFSLLGYDLVEAPPTPAGSVVLPISHRANPTPDAPPVHLVAPTQSLGSPDPTTTPRWSPHVLLQELLNRTDALWGIVSNGSVLRVLRRSTALVRPSYLEADVTAIIGEDRFDEFARLYHVLHRSRLPRTAADADDCILERWYRIGIEQGGRVRDRLRDGVEQAILTLANDLLAAGYRPPDLLSFYRDLLRFIYRLLFVFVADARGLMRGNDLYRDHYSVSRLIDRSIDRDAADDGFDLWHSLRALWYALRTDDIAPALGLAPLNGTLFAELPFDGQRVPNTTVVNVIRALTWYRPTPAERPRRVNYAALDTEELGSVYESLLDYHPDLADDGRRLTFSFTAGSERKTTGSYYTPPELVHEVVEQTLAPLIADRLRSASTPVAKRAALLDLRILDPACGSGHFLLAAARTLGRVVARLDAHGDEPSPDQVRRAVRDVIGHCIYGVDANPLAVELARVALWIEAHDGGKPLTFLDHRIVCGDSLVGVRDLAVLATGIPAGAFDPVSSDVRTVARAVAKRNAAEQAGQLGLFDAPPSPDLSALAALIRRIDAIADTTHADIRRKQELFAQMLQRATTLQTACDLWTAAFFQRRTTDTSETAWITTAAVWATMAGHAPPAAVAAAQEWTIPTPWLHWPLAFPDVVGDCGGFDVILANPPWERMKLQEQEFFAARDRTIADAPNAAARKRRIADLPQTNPALWQAYRDTLHRTESIGRFLRQSGHYPLAGRGDINTYAVFVERIRSLLRPSGRAGVIVPTGIATDDTTKHLFNDLVMHGQIAGVFDFANREEIFTGVHRSYKFCILLLGGREEPAAAFPVVCFATHPNHLHDPLRRYELTPAAITRVNPATRTLPIFRTTVDAALTLAIYERVPVLIPPEAGDGALTTGWNVRFLRMFDMANDSHLFRTRSALMASGYRLVGNRFLPPTPTAGEYLPLYEAKMIWHYDHRFGDYATVTERSSTQLPTPSAAQHADPTFVVQPWYWVPAAEVAARVRGWSHRWLLGFRDVTNATNLRTAIVSFVPWVGVNNKMPLIMSGTDPVRITCLMANLNALVFDFVARQKIGGTSLGFFILRQLPVLPPDAYTTADLIFIVPRVLELSYTAWDLAAFATDVWNGAAAPVQAAIRVQWDANRAVTGGVDPTPPTWADAAPFPPFRWDDARRTVLRAELDAYYARRYGLTRKQLRYILDPADLTPHELATILDPTEEMTDPLEPTGYAARVSASTFPGETFRVLKTTEINQYGEYRTRCLILEAWARLTDCAA